MTRFDPEAPQRERAALFQGLVVTFAIQSMITAGIGLIANASSHNSTGGMLLLASFAATSTGGFYRMTRECAPLEKVLVAVVYFPTMLTGYCVSALMFLLSLPGVHGSL